MYDILLPVDEDEERAMGAARTAASMPCAKEQVRVHIFSVFEEFDFTDAEGGQIRSEDLYESVELPDSVNQVMSYLEEKGVSAEIKRSHGDVPEEILSAVEDENIDQIIMSARKRTPVGKVLFGSVAQAVILNSPVPVTVGVTN